MLIVDIVSATNDGSHVVSCSNDGCCREICHSRGFNPDRNLTGIPLNLSYKSTLSLVSPDDVMPI